MLIRLELKGAEFSSGISMDAEAVPGFPACGSGIAMAASSSVQERVLSWEGVQCHLHSEAEKKCGAALSIPE